MAAGLIPAALVAASSRPASTRTGSAGHSGSGRRCRARCVGAKASALLVNMVAHPGAPLPNHAADPDQVLAAEMTSSQFSASRESEAFWFSIKQVRTELSVPPGLNREHSGRPPRQLLKHGLPRLNEFLIAERPVDFPGLLEKSIPLAKLAPLRHPLESPLDHRDRCACALDRGDCALR